MHSSSTTTCWPTTAIRPVRAVNLYAAYYGSQRKGASVHSPRTCLPGGGWQIADFAQHTVDGASVNGQPLRVNRALIKMGDAAQLVYYWFQQRGRVMTNEYLVKWYLFQDALLRGRTDGALVRLTTFVPPGGDLGAADARLGGSGAADAAELAPIHPGLAVRGACKPRYAGRPGRPGVESG